MSVGPQALEDATNETFAPCCDVPGVFGGRQAYGEGLYSVRVSNAVGATFSTEFYIQLPKPIAAISQTNGMWLLSVPKSPPPSSFPQRPRSYSVQASRDLMDWSHTLDSHTINDDGTDPDVVLFRDPESVSDHRFYRAVYLKRTGEPECALGERSSGSQRVPYSAENAI